MLRKRAQLLDICPKMTHYGSRALLDEDSAVFMLISATWLMAIQ
jgi:hypothetical protein